MELYGLKYNNLVFDVEDVEDYDIKGSFDPDSPSDIDYYGYRETTFTVTNIFIPKLLDDCSVLVPLPQDEVGYYSENYDREFTLVVQKALDEKEY